MGVRLQALPEGEAVVAVARASAELESDDELDDELDDESDDVSAEGAEITDVVADVETVEPGGETE